MDFTKRKGSFFGIPKVADMKVPKVKEPKLIRVGRSFRKLRNVKKRLKGLLKLRLFLFQRTDAQNFGIF